MEPDRRTVGKDQAPVAVPVVFTMITTIGAVGGATGTIMTAVITTRITTIRKYRRNSLSVDQRHGFTCL